MDKALRTDRELAAVDEAAGTAEVLPPWLTSRDEEEEPPWTRPWGLRSCLYRVRGCVAVGRGHRHRAGHGR